MATFVSVLARLIGILLIAALLYFSFKPEPQFIKEKILPIWLAEFGDQYPDFRTFVPYFLCSFLLPFLSANNRNDFPKKTVAWGAALLVAFLSISELIQWAMPKRVFSVMDLFWGGLGIVAGGVAAILIHLIISRPRESI
ncbi:MAG: hypothetical protein AAGJ81_09425 [Verrucomicrobiota bacterium]